MKNIRFTIYTATIFSMILMVTVSGSIDNVVAQTSPAGDAINTLSDSTINSILSGFNPVVGPIPTTSYDPPSGCLMPAADNSSSSINKIQCGLYASDQLNNETKTQEELQANQQYWTYGGDAPDLNAPYSFYKNSKGLHIGVQAPSSGTYAGYYAVTPNTNAMLFHSVITSPVYTLPPTNVSENYFQNGLYVQTSQAPVNYVTCVSITNSVATLWAVVHTYGSPFGSVVFDPLWVDTSSNQPLTRDCTIITNGQNYLKVYLDGTLVYSSNALALGMPAPFNAFLEPQSSYAGQELFGIYNNFYATTTENIQVQNNPSNAAKAEIVDGAGNVLASAPVILGNATIDVGKYHYPITANIRVVDSNNVQIASTTVIETVYGGDVYSVISGTPSVSDIVSDAISTAVDTANQLASTANQTAGSTISSGSTSNTSSSISATTYSGRAIALSVNTSVLITTFADTGPLPPQGGEIDASLLNIQTPLARSDGLVSVTMGFNNMAQSEATTSDILLLPGTTNQITADFIRSDSSTTCSGIAGTSDISNLQLAGQQITISGAVNQTITVPGVLTLVINEQIKSQSGGTNSITVNALDLKLASGGTLLVSSAHSDITCATTQTTTKDFTTGGGYIIVNNAHANFGFVAGYKHNTLSGQLNYVDHGNGMHLKSTSITSYSGTANTRTFSGQATINGVSGYTFTVTATDSGKLGSEKDTFSIQLSNGYSASGVLAGGNIKLHT